MKDKKQAEKKLEKPEKVDFTMKRAKQRYRAAHNNLGEEFPMIPLKEWIREFHRQFGKVKLSGKLERIILK